MVQLQTLKPIGIFFKSDNRYHTCFHKIWQWVIVDTINEAHFRVTDRAHFNTYALFFQQTEHGLIVHCGETMTDTTGTDTLQGMQTQIVLLVLV